MPAEPAVVVLAPGTLELGRRLHHALPGARLHGREPGDADVVVGDDVGAHLRSLFEAGTPIIGICAAGILIRTLAPLLADKRSEPPVLAVSADGASVVPLLGGHRGANRLAAQIARVLGAHAAITTASDTGGRTALDDPPPGWSLAPESTVKPLLARVRDGGELVVDDREVAAPWLEGARAEPGGAVDVCVTIRRDRPAPVVLVPRVLALGVGCERGLPEAELQALVDATLEAQGLAPEAVAAVVSLDLKAGEPAMRALADRLGVPFRVFGAAELETETPRLANPSEVVFREVGCHGVAEGAALAAAGPEGWLLVHKVKGARATMAIARAPVPIDGSSVGRGGGRLRLLSLGPGGRRERSLAVDDALRRCSDLVGYTGYLDQLEPSIGGRRHGFGLGQERERCRHALALAAEGLEVGLIGSGDVGIYAMGALVHEIAAGEPAFQAVPIEGTAGISAMHAAAARAGAPLGHDFCAVSLSDLLTPWSVIEERLAAAAAGDFVTALYNPVSRTRTEGFARARAIFEAKRPADTPCLVARNVGRPDERLTIVTLAELETAPVDMFTLVLIGSSTSRVWEDAYGRRHVFTPRGYSGG